ncbi:GntR family transcriptional regulator [Deinococcus aluminii]|uniref:HTH gntR-type domain-containing protein n=1 Tax=Deinococcus aluminii TaxID=1656885 RepID=A0ABP9XA34_9DEIO
MVAVPPLFSRDFRINRSTSIPIGLQIKGRVEYGIACGDFPPGTRLPTVRDLAQELGVSPVTVSQVYRQLQEEGLISSQPGRGTFVNELPAAYPAPGQFAHLDQLIDQLIAEAIHVGFDQQQLLKRIAARPYTLPSAGVRVMFIGRFQEATEDYVRFLQTLTPPSTQWTATTLQEFGTVLAQAPAPDLIVTLPNLVLDLRQQVGEAPPITDVLFIPSEATRIALAALDPRAQVVAVSTLPEFITTLRAGIERFAPHVPDVTYILHDAPQLAELVAAADAVVYATGSGKVRDLTPSRTKVFEYRYAPDPLYFEQHVLPSLRAIQAKKQQDAREEFTGLTGEITE